MKNLLTTLALTLGVALAGQASAGSMTCYVTELSNGTHQKCFSDSMGSMWQTRKETGTKVAPTIYKESRFGDLISTVDREGHAWKQEGGWRSVDGSSWGGEEITSSTFTTTETVHGSERN